MIVHQDKFIKPNQFMVNKSVLIEELMCGNFFKLNKPYANALSL